MFRGGPRLIDSVAETVHAVAPKARLVRLSVPPVLGAALIGMEAAGVQITPGIRENMTSSIASVQGVPANQGPQ
jgi:hypothetical protein